MSTPAQTDNAFPPLSSGPRRGGNGPRGRGSRARGGGQPRGRGNRPKAVQMTEPARQTQSVDNKVLPPSLSSVPIGGNVNAVPAGTAALQRDDGQVLEGTVNQNLKQNPDTEFTDRMRNMILSHGVPGAHASTVSGGPTGSDVTPDLQSSTPRKRMTQAERRHGQTNKLDLRQFGHQTYPRQPQQAFPPSQGQFSYSQDAVPSPHLQHSYGYLRQGHLPSPPITPQYTDHRSPSARGLGPEQHSRPDDYVPPHLRGLKGSWGNSAASLPANSRPPRPSNDSFNRGPPTSGQLYDPTNRPVNLRPPYRQAQYLEQLAQIHIPQAGMTTDALRANEHIRQRLESLIRNVFASSLETADIDPKTVRLECFGSIASGFATRESDMDLMLVYAGSEEDAKGEAHTGIPRQVEMALLDAGYGARLLTRTRVPIIRFCELPPLELLEQLRREREKWEVEKDKAKDEDDESKEKESEKGNDDDAGEDQQDPEDGEDGNDHDDDDKDEDNASTKSGSVDEDILVLDFPTKPKDVAATNGESQQEQNLDAAIGEDDGSQDVNALVKAQKSSKKSPVRKKGKKKSKGTHEVQKPRPLPYESDEERLKLYQLAIKEGWFNQDERKIITAFGEAFEQANGINDESNLVEARKALEFLPDVLSKYRAPRKRKQELEYPKDGVGVLCDINFSSGSNSNPLALHNTRLLRCYSLCDPRIREMVLFVKAWAKRRKINKPYHGTLSSYGYVLMVLHYVVNIANPPLAPNLQQLSQRNADYLAPETCNGYDIRFWQDEAALKAASSWEFGQNQESVGSLLCGFFRYYAVNSYRGVKGFQWTHEVLSLRTPGGIISKADKGWTGAWKQAKEGDDAQKTSTEITHRYLLAIEDPFEITHNVGRPVMHHGIVAIRDEFRRANQLIVSQGSFNGMQTDLFEEGVEQEREHRFFGPRPGSQHKIVKFGPKNLVGDERKRAMEKIAKKYQQEERELQKQHEAANRTENGVGKAAGITELKAGSQKEETGRNGAENRGKS